MQPLTEQQRARLEGLRQTHNKLRAGQGLPPLTLEEFADAYRQEAAARGSTYTFLDVDEYAAGSPREAGFDSSAAFACLNRPYTDRLTGGVRGAVNAATAKPPAPAAAAATDPFAVLNRRYDEATSRAHVGGSRDATALGADA